MKTFISAILLFATTAFASDNPVYQMDYATIERGSTGIRGGLYYFKVNETHMMPATCLRNNKIHIDAVIPTSSIAYTLIYEASIRRIPTAFLSWVVRADGDCYLKNLRLRDVTDADSYNLIRLYLHPTLNDKRQFWAEGCPDPFEPYAILGYEYQTQPPGGDWSAVFGGVMDQMVGTTCESQAPIGIVVTPGYKIRWRVVQDQHKTDWVSIVW